MLKGHVIDGLDGINFHHFGESALLRFKQNPTWKNLSIRRDRPDIVLVQNGIIPAAYRQNEKFVSGVYDRTNRLIKGSVRVRGPNKKVRESAIEQSELQAPVRDNRSAYFLGSFGKVHYGHFLLETLCRAWAWPEMCEDRVPVIQAWAEIPSFARAFYALIPGIGDRVEAVRRTTQFNEVIVAEPAFVARNAAHVEFRVMCQRIAAEVVSTPQDATEQPLYLSRAGLSESNRRVVIGEERVERLLEREGFRVVRPETLPVVEQIALVNRHRHIVAPVGSACHTRLFAAQPTNLVMFTRDELHVNYALCDLLCPGAAHYVNLLWAPKMRTEAKLSQVVEPVFLHEEALLDVLKEFGFVRPGAAFDGVAPSFDEYKKVWARVAKKEGLLSEDDGLISASEDVLASIGSGEARMRARED